MLNNRHSCIPIGSKFQTAQKSEPVHLEPIKQSIGRKANPNRGKSSINCDFTYKILLERQMAKVKKYCPKADPAKLIDLSHSRPKDILFQQIANNFKMQREQIKVRQTTSAPKNNFVYSTSTSIDLKREGRDNPTTKQYRQYSHRSQHSDHSRFAHTAQGSRDSIDLKAPQNARSGSSEHFRSMSAKDSESIQLMKDLHVPSRRENYNSYSSLSLGSETSQM